MNNNLSSRINNKIVNSEIDVDNNQNSSSKNKFQKLVDNVEGFFLMLLKKIGLKKLVDWYLAHQEGMRYLVFGALSTVINIFTFAICTNVFRISKLFEDNIIVMVSNVIAWIIAVLFAYVTNKLSVFNSKTNSTKELITEILYFFGARVFTLILETIFLTIFITKLHFNEILMKICSNIIVIIVNFVLSKLIIFKKK